MVYFLVAVLLLILLLNALSFWALRREVRGLRRTLVLQRHFCIKADNTVARRCLRCWEIARTKTAHSETEAHTIAEIALRLTSIDQKLPGPPALGWMTDALPALAAAPEVLPPLSPGNTETT